MIIIDVDICFETARQFINEGSALATVTLVLSYPLSSYFTLSVISTDGSAIGKLRLLRAKTISYIILKEEVLIINMIQTVSLFQLGRSVLHLIFP